MRYRRASSRAGMRRGLTLIELLVAIAANAGADDRSDPSR